VIIDREAESRNKTGFPPAPGAPLRSTPRIEEKYSRALKRKAQEGMTDQDG
jgi:hypothetical protein